MPIAAILVMLAAIVAPVAAEDGNGKFAVKGAGTLQCKVYIAEREKKSNVYYLIGGWLEGYLSAYNRYVDATFDVASFESTELLLAIMNGHCMSHPEDRIYSVANALVGNLAEQRLRSASPRVQISDGKRTALLYQTTIQRIQEALATRKLYKGEVDGVYTDATRAAVIAFQTDIKFDPTGFPDQATLWRLLRK